MKIKINADIEMPEGVSASIEAGVLKVTGEKGEVQKKLLSKKIKIDVKDKVISLSADRGTKREKRMNGTFKAHIRNMIKGCTEGHEYKLKICSGHFPMNVAVEGNSLSIKNFLGEKVPRKLEIQDGVKVEVNGTDVIVTGIDKGLVSQVTANIEQLTRITNKDRRIFQDGIWIVAKDGKEIK